MCRCLNISRSSYYIYKEKQERIDELNETVIEIFDINQKVYETRKIKVELMKRGHQVSRRRIARIIHHNGLVSVYTVKKYKVHTTKVNEAAIVNEVNREFNNKAYKEVVVSDLTYVKVNNKWCYICILLDLHNREIIGYSCKCGKVLLKVIKATG